MRRCFLSVDRKKIRYGTNNDALHWNVDIPGSLITIWLRETNKNDFTIRQTDDSSLTIYTKDQNTYNIILNTRKEKEIRHYTYTPKSLKPKNIILKGIRGKFSETEIFTEINELNIPDIRIKKVSKIDFNKKNINENSS